MRRHMNRAGGQNHDAFAKFHRAHGADKKETAKTTAFMAKAAKRNDVMGGSLSRQQSMRHSPRSTPALSRKPH